MVSQTFNVLHIGDHGQM